MTTTERDDTIAAIEAVASGIAETIDWRADSDPRITRISLAPNGPTIKVISVSFNMDNLRQPLRYSLDNEGDLYTGGERGFGNQQGRQVSLNERSDAVLVAVLNALNKIANKD